MKKLRGTAIHFVVISFLAVNLILVNTHIFAAKSLNRQNAFNDQNMCNSIQKYLMKSCSAYVNSKGVLTTEGKRAKGCISNGMLLVGGGTYLTSGALWLIGPSGIIDALKPLAQATGCGGIVNWQLLENDASSARAFLNLMGIR